MQDVKEGSSGVWGGTVMPSHPELPDGEIGKMIGWIFNFREEKNVEYYLGKEGAFKVQKSGAVTLTASYLDHNGTMGEDVVRMLVE